MSGLSYICGYGYGSNSDDSDCEYGVIATNKQKLPTPDLSNVPVVAAESHVDDPDLHGGRTRSFPHVRGNWATFVCIKYPEEEDFLKLVHKLQSVAYSIDDSFQKCEDIHISLSKTFVLKYHLINPFSSSMQAAVRGVKSFDLAFEGVKVYCNEELTRTFISLTVDHFSHKHLQNITKKINGILEEYKLPTFYKDPSFHMSVLWTNGNKQKQLTNVIEALNDTVTEFIGKYHKTVSINSVHCKSGNKHFQYFLE